MFESLGFGVWDWDIYMWIEGKELLDLPRYILCMLDAGSDSNDACIWRIIYRNLLYSVYQVC
jgi:hypothetical protein